MSGLVLRPALEPLGLHRCRQSGAQQPRGTKHPYHTHAHRHTICPPTPLLTRSCLASYSPFSAQPTHAHAHAHTHTHRHTMCPPTPLLTRSWPAPCLPFVCPTPNPRHTHHTTQADNPPSQTHTPKQADRHTHTLLPVALRGRLLGFSLGAGRVEAVGRSMNTCTNSARGLCSLHQAAQL
jgi:hypothetical protein